MSRRIDLTGKTFGEWTVLKWNGANSNNQSTWFCRCNCGTERAVVAQTLREGTSVSCGCTKGEAIAKARTTHGGAYKKSYQVWKDMMRRCYTPVYAQYHYHGGRGISVCERWHNYKNFVEDMGEPPVGLTLERIDNDGNYNIDNCKWATWKEQIVNRRVVRNTLGQYESLVGR